MVFAPTTLIDIDGDGPPAIVVAGTAIHVLDAKGTLLWEAQCDAHSIARGVAVGDVSGDVSGDGRADIVFGAGTRLVGLDARDGSEVLSVDLKSSDDPREAIESAPLIFDAVGDNRLEVFVVVGRGLYQGMEDNFGRGVLIRTSGHGTPEWVTFRGGPRRVGSAHSK